MPVSSELRIGLFTDSDVFAGTERHILDLATALRDEGCGVVLVCPGNGETARRGAAAGLQTADVPKGGPLDWRAVLRLRRLLAAGRVDVLHAHNGRSALLGALAVRLAGRGGLVVTQHFIHPSRLRRRGIGRLLARGVHGWVSRRVDRFIAVSESARQEMLSRGDCEADRVVLIHNGINPPPAVTPDAVNAVRAGLGVHDGVSLVVCVARLSPEKDLPTLIAAVAQLPPEVEVVCAIVGEGSEMPALRDQTRESGVESRVRLVGFRADAAAFIGACDLFVLPSRAEPFGLVLLEAMALAKPVVAAAAGGPLEIVQPGITGTLFSPGDPGSLATAIARLVRDARLRATMGVAGRERFSERFTACRMASETAAVYREACRPRGLHGRRLVSDKAYAGADEGAIDVAH